MVRHQYKVDKIIKKISKYKYVSFDIFDTLIKRNVEKASDIFKLVQLEYENKYNKKIDNYKDIRIKAEVKARTINNSKEPNIDDIYKCLELNKEEYDIEELKQMEINLEYKFCQKNNDFYPVYKYCIDNDKKIIITSDMYLKKEQIIKILNNAEIEKFDYLFLSNDVKLNKHNGTIYKYILNKLKIKPNQIIHIGDSKRGDYLMPKVYQINSVLIPKKINKLKYCNDKPLKNQEEGKFFYSITEKFINNNIPKNENEYYKLGYETLGILLYGYTQWLLDELKKSGIKKVFFLAREGALLKRAFDIMNSTDIESKYLYVSRRSTRVPLLKNVNNLDDIFSIVKMRRITDVKSFFEHVGLDCKKYKELLEKYNCNEITNIKNIDNMDSLFDKIKPDIIKNAVQEEEKLIGYLKQEGFKDKIAVSDVGWEGTMQNALCTISANNDISVDITGFYIGQSPEAEKYIKQNMKTNAYLFDYDADGYKEIRAFLNLFESFFLAQHGTTTKYEIDNGKYIPVLEKIEYTEEEQKIFKNIQEGAIKFIEDYIKKDYSVVKILPFCSFLNIRKIGIAPTLKDVNLFANITYLETIKGKFANPKKLIYYIIHPKEMYIDFCNCSWKIGFLKKLFKININYYNLYKLILK